MDKHNQHINWLSFKQGEEKGFTYFFKEYYPVFCQFANRLIGDAAESESLVSEAILKVWKHRQKLATPLDFKRYCYSAIKNECIYWHRKKRKYARRASESTTLPELSERPILDSMIHAELIETLHRSIQALPPQCAKIVSKLYVDGLSIKETAEHFNLSVSTIKTQKKIGISYLRKAIISVITFLFPLSFLPF